MSLLSQNITPRVSRQPYNVRLLEKPGNDQVEEEVKDILWEMVETVHNYDIRPPELSSVVYEGTTYLWNRETNELHDKDGGAIVGKMVGASPWLWNCISSDGVCNRCDHSDEVIVSRGFGWEDYLELRDMGNGVELICRSCVLGGNLGGDHFYCTDCGYSELLSKQAAGAHWVQFYLEGETRPEYQDENTRCHGCRARVERYERYEREEMDSVVRVLFPEDGEEDWSETYYDELELAEDEEDHNGPKALRVKETVKGMGAILFDIKDKISEGEYLKLMDGLQDITNEMND
jgi:hypothetical protein